MRVVSGMLSDIRTNRGACRCRKSGSIRYPEVAHSADAVCGRRRCSDVHRPAGTDSPRDAVRFTANLVRLCDNLST